MKQEKNKWKEGKQEKEKKKSMNVLGRKLAAPSPAFLLKRRARNMKVSVADEVDLQSQVRVRWML